LVRGLTVEANGDFWSGKRVFLTGHTGFKGSWLSLWLSDLGAAVHGFALNPSTDPSMFEIARVRDHLATHTVGDVRDPDAVARAMTAAQPEIVIHMAAQPLVRYSYDHPLETYSVNVMGTVHVLEAARRLGSVRALVNVTTDKCYQNKEWLWAYREDEPLGGHDPYSSSKACAELVSAAYRTSFGGRGAPWIATARAGNVIGGGDWALDRILPDLFRALDADQPLVVRNPGAIRPWQHVLEPLSGYLTLTERLYSEGAPFAEGWNFGPTDDDARPVGWIVDRIRALVPELDYRPGEGAGVHEARFLKLDGSKARALLGWHPTWRLETALEKTLAWHRAWRDNADMAGISMVQITAYRNAARIAGAHG
jgi:CDP-glucose 4,6-dehydratase